MRPLSSTTGMSPLLVRDGDAVHPARASATISRILKINELETITDDVVEAAASVLVIGS